MCNAPHVTKRDNLDGTARYYFRKRGLPIVRLPGSPGESSFEQAYQRCISGTEEMRRVPPDRAIAGYRLHWARTQLRKIRNRAQHQYKDTSCELTEAEIIDILECQRDRCALSGRKFRYLRPETLSGRDPYAPSIDRIDSSGGYERDNCRAVLLAVNIGLSDWSDADYIKICRSVANTSRKASGNQ